MRDYPVTLAKNGRPISNLDDWFLYAPPKSGPAHWVDGRSAKELAREYLTPKAWERLLSLLTPAFGSSKIESAKPECLISFDQFGGPRNCDLVVQATSDSGQIVIHIEGKGDEPFDGVVGAIYDTKVAFNAMLDQHSPSGVPHRIEQLVKRLFGLESLAPVRGLRYQLLFSTAAALSDALAKNASVAILLVHEFHSSRTNPIKSQKNSDDWKQFLSTFPELNSADLNGEEILFGPINVPHSPWSTTRLYFAKFSTWLPISSR